MSEAPQRRMPRWLRAIVVVTVWLAVFEGAGWALDAVYGHRAQLLEGLALLEPTQDPVTPESAPPGLGLQLSIRQPEPPGQKSPAYRLGGRDLPNAHIRPKQVTLLPRHLARDKRKRVFIVGGSAAFGYTTPFFQSATGLLSRSLADSHAVINAAQVGWPSGFVVHAAERILAEFAPDVLVIQCGNNEWIRWVPSDQPWITPERLALYRTLAQSRLLAAVLRYGFNRGVAEGAVAKGADTGFVIHHELEGFRYALAHPAGERFDPARWLAEKHRHLEALRTHLQRMVRGAKAKGASAILMTIAYNHKLSVAWKHPQPLAFDPANRARMAAAAEEAVVAIDKGDHAAALKTLDAALALEPRPPLLHALRAHALERLDRHAEAERAYAQAREHMVGNLGSRLSVNRVIREVAEAEKVPLVDVQALFERHQRKAGRFYADGLIDDDCHPNAKGNALVAEALKTALTARDAGAQPGL